MKTGSNIRGALSYNEQKVRSGHAELVLASGFSCDIENLSFSQKMTRFQQLINRNLKIKTNTLHLSLNFSPKEILSDETMQNIARDYMDKIGFGAQPFLVYRHDDSSHPHLHIVTTPIQVNHKSIYMHRIGERMSEPARKQIELDYNLVRAEDQKKDLNVNDATELKDPAIYGRQETKRVISNTVQDVMTRYKFSSLSQFNALLRQYNIKADRGDMNSSMYLNNGLVYSMIDRYGYQVGVSIKASSIYSKPTLEKLLQKSEQNKIRKISSLPYTRSKVNRGLKISASSKEFISILKQKDMSVHVERNANNYIKEIHFIDHKSKAIFTCLELGYTTGEILAKLNVPQAGLTSSLITSENRFSDPEFLTEARTEIGTNQPEIYSDLLKSLFSDQQSHSGLSSGQHKKKKKKKKH